MQIISEVFHNFYDAEYEALEQDEAYQTARDARNELSKTLVMSLTRKQRVLFHQFQAQQDAVMAMELRRLFSHCTLLLELRGK